MSQKPLFQLRKELDDSGDVTSDANVTQSFAEQFESTSNVEPSVTTNFTNKLVLTENAKYTVAKLPAEIPRQLESESIDGYVDTLSQNAIVNDSDTLYMWEFATTQLNPMVTRVPLHEDHISLSCVPKIIVTWPAALDDDLNSGMAGVAAGAGTAGSTIANNCGICIVNRKSGLIQFYEDVDSINNLSSRISRTKCHELTLSLKDTEFVMDVVNAEPAGILISTTRGRLFFVTIRDFMGKPHLNLKLQMIKSHLALFFSSQKLKKIVSLKPGPILGKGERLVSVLTSGGDFQIWNLSAVANCYKRAEFNVYDQILESLKDLYPCAYNSLMLLDSHPLSDDNSAHMILSSITDYDGASYYILTTIKLDEQTNGFIIFSTYRLNTYTSASQESNPPRLLVPMGAEQDTTAITSVYTVFHNAVVLTQVSAKLDQTYSLRRKWEDIISFREDAEIFGQGMDSRSIYLMSRKMGVLMITASLAVKSNDLQETRFIKSHIDQAVYFSNLPCTPIDFNLPLNISLEREEIEEDLLASGEEILLSKSIYIPPNLKSVERHLSLRVELFKKLLNFTKFNFLHKISPAVKIQLIESLEVLNTALGLLTYIRNSQPLSECWQHVMQSNKLDEDTFLKHDLDRFPKVFSQFLEEVHASLIPSSTSNLWSLCAELVISCLFKCTLEDGEEFYRFDMFQMDKNELGAFAPWYVQNQFPALVSQLFAGLCNYANLSKDKVQHSEQLLSLAKILYYFCNQASLWFLENPSRTASKEFEEISKLYRENRSFWNQTLCAFDKKLDSLEISEFYEDLPSLAETLSTLPTETSEDLYMQYFEKFGYSFAVEVFSNFIAHGKLQDLYERFPKQHELLRHFFDQNPQFGEVGWMCKVFDERYDDASAILVEITTKQTNSSNELGVDQTRLSIAKLCILADKNATDFDRLTTIQAELDVIDGQKDLRAMIEDGAKQNRKQESSHALQKLFGVLNEKIALSQRLELSEVVEMYTLLESKDCFYKAAKIVSLNKSCLGFENYKFLNAMIWRRCVLFDDWTAHVEETDTALFHSLRRCFDDKLFEKGSTIPDLPLIMDQTLVTSEYFEAEYKSLDVDINGLLNQARLEQAEVKSLDASFETTMKSIIASSNDCSTHKCVINYETGQVEEAGR
ncbi:LANO_0H23992g1_1 [Lachancea nothofagi CBS 11611]|uniref:LANO_0H23992g1_1 n=1 Tax=Lachancea nothofagi CBS 11611 TaxID=1266666 RepID=A0A1G4KNP0_9SACH|nr:LANO_0H23992g1_1 [Lachancea nothofagi CBS 11611]